jgi:hypothetical protein
VRGVQAGHQEVQREVDLRRSGIGSRKWKLIPGT